MSAEKWPPALDGAIREEIVRGKLRPSEAWEKVQAGTLDGLDPIPIPRRTFYYRWSKAQHQLARAGEEQAQFPRLIHRLMAQMVDGWEDLGPEQLAEAIRERFGEKWSAAQASEVLDSIVAYRNSTGPAPVGREA